MLRHVVLASVLLCAVTAADQITREQVISEGKSRDYFLYVPPSLQPESGAPLLVLLHGSGRDGKSLVDPWKSLAAKEGIILAGPNSTDRAGWDLKKDGPYFIADLIDAVRSNHTVDLRRLYLFGHSAGAIQALMLGLLESEYFAAVGVHAGALPSDAKDIIDMHDRKIPLGIWVGMNDPLFPRAAVEGTKQALEARGLTVLYKPIPNHTHNYYQRSDLINAEVWAFLSEHKLTQNPRFKEYDLK